MKNMIKSVSIIVVLFSIILFNSCVTNSAFENTIIINAPADIVFSVITDYEKYPELLPMLHDSMTIVSEQKTGLGVVWESTGSFKGHKFTSQWTITEYIENQKVVMEDLKDHIGKTVLELHPLSAEKTEYKMYLITKMFKPYEQDFFAIYNKEMSIIKEESERRYSNK